jgi:hypothetical protein
MVTQIRITSQAVFAIINTNVAGLKCHQLKIHLCGESICLGALYLLVNVERYFSIQSDFVHPSIPKPKHWTEEV